MNHVVSHTRELWEEARGRSFFLTGGTGFFGVWLLESFCHANESLGLGMKAVILTRDAAGFARRSPHLAGRSCLRFVQGDIRTFEFPAEEFTYVIHAATEALGHHDEGAAQEILDVIIGGTGHTLELAARNGVKKLLLTSSGAVYGPQPSGLTHIPEDYPGAPDPLLPASAYGEAKRVSEHQCVVHALRFGYEAKIARCFAFLGPGLSLDGPFAAGNFISDVVDGRPVRIKGDGTALRSYLYAADLAVWLWTILFRGTAARAYNVGSDAEVSIAELARQVVTAAGCGEVQIAAAGQSVSPSRYVPNPTRAFRELGLSVTIDLPEALQRTLTYYGHVPFTP